jgi:hypothetical protein
MLNLGVDLTYLIHNTRIEVTPLALITKTKHRAFTGPTSSALITSLPFFYVHDDPISSWRGTIRLRHTLGTPSVWEMTQVLMA